MAQPGSAHAWGAWGRRFKSCHPDFSGLLYIYLMGISKKLISKKKPFYPISGELKLFLKNLNKEKYWTDFKMDGSALRFNTSYTLISQAGNNKLDDKNEYTVQTDNIARAVSNFEYEISENEKKS